MAINNACASCDYRLDCHKKIIRNGEAVLAKEQDEIDMKCVCIVQDICRACKLFIEKKCAAWKMLNGIEVPGKLVVCPKRVPAEGAT